MNFTGSIRGNWIQRLSAIAITCVCALGLSSSSLAENQTNSIGLAGSDFIVGLSPFLEKSVKDDIYRSIVRLIVEELTKDSTLTIYDAFELKTISQVTVPNGRAFNSPKTRANQFAPAIRDLKQFLAQERSGPTNSLFNFVDSLRLPQFLDFLAEKTSPTSRPAVLLIGSPLYLDSKETAFSMVDGYFPSDGHLQASREKSVFGFDGGARTPLMVQWMYFGDPWVSDLHREKVTRFWTLYLERSGSQLAAFTGDLPTALQSFRQSGSGVVPTSKGWVIDTTQTKIEMLRVGRGVEVNDWITRDSLSMAQVAPSTMVGPMKIGIRWKEKVDLDLYATPRLGAETLYFEHRRSPEGYYYRDHRSSPGREYEFIEFESPVDIHGVQAFVNFYKGEWPGGAHGEVRIEFDGRIYGGPFSIPAERGNLGRGGRTQDEYWTPIPIQKLLKLVQTANRQR